MRVSALDIKKQEFNRVLRGYDAEEVHAFLSELARQWEEAQADLRRSEDRERELAGKLEHYQRVEEALQEALQTAREGARQALENAKHEASLVVKKAMGEADDLTRSAARQRDALLHEIDDLLKRREEIVARLRAFLNAEVEMLARFDERETLGTGLPRVGEGPPVDPTMTAGTVTLSRLDPAVLEPDEQTGRLPVLGAPELAVIADAAATAAVPEEVPFDVEGLDAVLHEMSHHEAPPAEADHATGTSEPAPSDVAPGAEAAQAREADAEDTGWSGPDAFDEAPLPASDDAGEAMPGEEAAAVRVEEPQAEEAGSSNPEAGVAHDADPKEHGDTTAALASSEEDPLLFRFFEPHQEGEASLTDAGKRDPHYGPDQTARRPSSYGYEEDFAVGDEAAWPASPSGQEHGASTGEEAGQDGLAASSEEIEKIKRILSDLD